MEGQNPLLIGATVVILTKNSRQYIRVLVDHLKQQLCSFEYEIIAVDSGSTDDTLQILDDYQVKCILIPEDQFSFGAAKNLAVKQSRGVCTLFLSQDALPSTRHWLQISVVALLDSGCVAAAGRQLPPVGADPMEVHLLSYVYPEFEQIYHDSDVGTFVRFSTVNCVALTDVLQRYPFDESLVMSEDQEWAQRILKEGYSILYNPRAAVYHGHKYSLLGVFQRYYDSGSTLRGILPKEYRAAPLPKSTYISSYFRHYVKRKLWWQLPYAALYEVCRVSGYYLGLHEEIVPHRWRRRLSRYSRWVRPGENL